MALVCIPKKEEIESMHQSPQSSSGLTGEENPICVCLDLEKYKARPCRRKECLGAGGDTRECLDHHSPQDSRRPFVGRGYLASRCPDACGREDCRFTLNIIEEKYHPSMYKRKFCRKFLTERQCGFGQTCPFVHSEAELKLRPLHLLPIDTNFFFFQFKSQFCPFSWQRHNAFTCVYAHNWQDFKRPYFSGQLAKPCPRWKDSARITEYLKGCPEGFDCKFCHGWKELDFHPLHFKKTPCSKHKKPLPFPTASACPQRRLSGSSKMLPSLKSTRRGSGSNLPGYNFAPQSCTNNFPKNNSNLPQNFSNLPSQEKSFVSFNNPPRECPGLDRTLPCFDETLSTLESHSPTSGQTPLLHRRSLFFPGPNSGRRGDSDRSLLPPSPDFLEKHLCCFRHPGESPPDFDPRHFEVFNPSLDFSAYSTLDFLSEIALSPAQTLPLLPQTRPSAPYCLFDFLVFDAPPVNDNLPDHNQKSTAFFVKS